VPSQSHESFFSELKSAQWPLQSVSVRARFAEQTFLGDDAVEKFNAIDLSSNFKMPYTLYTADSWELGTNMMLSAGLLKTFDENALALSVIPELMLRTREGGFTANAGFGLAAFTRNKFGVQDFGGPVQFAITFGATVELSTHIRLGYRFQHYSDARAYGSDTTGADLHMVELYYQF
jgi:hypothetical protein